LQRGDGRERRKNGGRQGNALEKRPAFSLQRVVNGFVKAVGVDFWSFRHE
jgi:hypothetical protein